MYICVGVYIQERGSCGRRVISYQSLKVSGIVASVDTLLSDEGEASEGLRLGLALMMFGERAGQSA